MLNASAAGSVTHGAGSAGPQHHARQIVRLEALDCSSYLRRRARRRAGHDVTVEVVVALADHLLIRPVNREAVTAAVG